MSVKFRVGRAMSKTIEDFFRNVSRRTPAAAVFALLVVSPVDAQTVVVRTLTAVEQFDDPQAVQDSFTVQGAGADIWGFEDDFQFVYQVEANFAATVQARVVSEQPTDPDAKVGVMIRDGLAPDAAFVILDMKPNGELEFMQRFSPRSEVTYLGGAMLGFNAWIRLERHEPTDLATVTAAFSADGITWTGLGQTLVNMSKSVEMGVAVTSHDATVLNTALVDHVRVGTGAP